MTCLVDTDVLAAWVSRREDKHGEAAALLQRAVEGEWGTPWLTDFVVDEALTLLMARGAPLHVADRILSAALGVKVPGASPPLPLVRVSDASYRHAIPLFRRHYRRGLSFTDCTSLAVAQERHANVILSFDRGFDGLLARVSA